MRQLWKSVYFPTESEVEEVVSSEKVQPKKGLKRKRGPPSQRGEHRIDSFMKHVMMSAGINKENVEICTRNFELERKAIKRRRLERMKGMKLSKLVQSTLRFKGVDSAL